jgi:hypothetical protein
MGGKANAVSARSGRAMLSDLQRAASGLMVWLGWYDSPRLPEPARAPRPGWLPLASSTAAEAGSDPGGRASGVAGAGGVQDVG